MIFLIFGVLLKLEIIFKREMLELYILTFFKKKS